MVVSLPQKSFISFSPTFRLGLSPSRIRNHFNDFSWATTQQHLPLSFKRPTSQDLDPFSTGHTSGPARNSNDAERPLKVGKNEIKDF